MSDSNQLGTKSDDEIVEMLSKGENAFSLPESDALKKEAAARGLSAKYKQEQFLVQRKDGRQTGPHNASEIKRLFLEGELTKDSMIHIQEIYGWTALASVFDIELWQTPMKSSKFFNEPNDSSQTGDAVTTDFSSSLGIETPVSSTAPSEAKDLDEKGGNVQSLPKLDAESQESKQSVHVPDLGPLARFARLMLIITIIANLISAFSDFFQFQLLSRPDLASVDESILLANDTRQQAIASIELIIFIITAIAVLRWVHRANSRCRALGADDMKFTPGWAVGYFFIPVLWLFKPYQAMKEIWKASANPHNWQNEKGSWLLVTWWTLWVITSLIGYLSLRISMGAESLAQFQGLTVLSILNSLLDIPLSIALLAIINAVQNRFNKNARLE